ncbi:MAG: VOC family protein, partial [Nitrospirae bacterium]|nr:VOC family protein [Nitrospirota bacterium]
VDSVDNKLKEMGSAAEITLGPLNFDDFIKGWRSVWLKDPEGNIVELSEGYKD